MTVSDAYDDDVEEGAEPAGPQVSKRSRGLALGLAVFGGWCGLHRFYAGKIGTGIAMLCTFGGCCIWWLYDVVLLAAGEFRDADDLPLRNWNVEETQPLVLRGPAARRLDEIDDQLEGLRRQFSDLAERVDFAERMLAQQRERPQLPRGS